MHRRQLPNFVQTAARTTACMRGLRFWTRQRRGRQQLMDAPTTSGTDKSTRHPVDNQRQARRPRRVCRWLEFLFLPFLFSTFLSSIKPGWTAGNIAFRQCWAGWRLVFFRRRTPVCVASSCEYLNTCVLFWVWHLRISIKYQSQKL